MTETYYGHAILNGPPGAADTPERDIPEVGNGFPTVIAVVLECANATEARRKMILWHMIQNRLLEFHQDRDSVYGDKKVECAEILYDLQARIMDKNFRI